MTNVDTEYAGDDHTDAARVPYGAALRTVGALLDQRSATSATVLETPEGMMVLYEPGDRGTIEAVKLSHMELAQEGSTGVAAHTVHVSAPLLPGGTYEDRLRTLGHALERVSGSGVLLTQAQDDFMVSYQYYDPGSAPLLRKRALFVSAGEQRSLAEMAPDRGRLQVRDFLHRVTG
jgi:hypothetical protein